MSDRKTIFSPCRKYRYTLWRSWAFDPMFDGCNGDDRNMRPGEYVVFIGLNPSTADETLDDPTIRRCINFAKSWGFGAFCMLNLFAFRATDPEVMKKEGGGAIGGDNMEIMKEILEGAGMIVCAWGKHGAFRDRGNAVLKWIMQDLHLVVHALARNADGSPKHPLYIRADATPIAYN